MQVQKSVYSYLRQVTKEVLMLLFVFEQAMFLAAKYFESKEHANHLTDEQAC